MTTSQPNDSPLAQLYAAFTEGAVSRRAFVRRATAMGVSAATATFLANAGVQAASGQPSRNGFAFTAQNATPDTSPEASPAASPVAGTSSGAPDFGTAKQTAVAMMQCIASSGYYRHLTGSTQVFSRRVSVDGMSGWAIRTEIRVDNPGLSVDGDIAEIVVVDTGTKGQLSFFGGFVPIGDQPRIRILDQTIDSLRVD